MEIETLETTKRKQSNFRSTIGSSVRFELPSPQNKPEVDVAYIPFTHRGPAQDDDSTA